MQNAPLVSLNALRVFLAVAERSSMKDAAQHLGVTAGAVSHQVRTLEDALGVKLLARNNNSVEMTPAGRQLLQDALPGAKVLNAAIDRVRRDANELRVQVTLSLATRWLVPKLHLFQQRNPQARVRIETSFGIDQVPDPDADVSVQYYRRGQLPEGAEVLFNDMSRPYLSPNLLSAHAGVSDIRAFPALQTGEGNWDWTLWLLQAGLDASDLNLAARFDVDDTALRAAIAGLGMVLMSEFMIADDLAEGHLCPLPNAPVALLGHYVIHQNAHETGLSRRFTKWLRTTAKALILHSQNS